MNKHVIDKPRGLGASGRLQHYVAIERLQKPTRHAATAQRRPVKRDNLRRIQAYLRIARGGDV